jgi:dipeptidyl aminopeptidase/acylaminoacyl peptidase
MLATCPEESGLDPTGAAAPDPSARVQAVCDWFGPTDLWRLAFKDRQQYAIMSLLLGGNVAEHRDRATAASPLTYIRKGDPPFLIMHGDADPLVPLEQSVALDAALRQAGVESELRILPGAGHWTSDFETPEVLDTVARFFTKHLKPAAAGPAPAAPAGVGK